MFVEKRDDGKTYLVHSYRDITGKVEKIRRYLGQNLSQNDLNRLRKRAEEIIKQQIKEEETEVFNLSLSDKEIVRLNKYDNKIRILHLNKKEWEQFTEDFVYNTNAIEGSTIAKDEVHDILSKKKVKDPEEIETKGVAMAIEFIKETKEDISIGLIKKLHKLCFKGSKDFAGKLRTVEVVIRNRTGEIIHQGTPAKNLESELKRYVSWYNENKSKFKPLVLAAIMHNQFEYMHPFQDGNGRVGRLILNFVLIKNDYPPINILLKDRAEYYKLLNQYSIHNELKPTLDFLLDEYKKTLNKVTTKKK